MKKSVLFFSDFYQPSFALSTCQKAVRANAVEKTLLKLKSITIKQKEHLSANKAALIAQIDSALKAIESANARG